MQLLDEHELARRVDGRLKLREHPLRVRWTFDDVVSADGHALRCALECSVRALPDPTERRMLQEVLLGERHRLTADEVAEHFQGDLQKALRKVLEPMRAADALSDAGRAPTVEALKSAAAPVAFASGVEVLPPFHLEIESPSLQQQRLREMQRDLAERHAAGQVEHFAKAAELLKQYQAMRQAAPELSAGQVLQQISPADRGSVLQTLLLASAKQATASDLWAVAGPYLVRVDARVTPAKTELIPLPPTLGPLRSVQPARVNDERVLLVGARSGFMVVRPDSPGEPELYHDPDVKSDLGFSRVVYWAETQSFAACHGDAGIVRWGLNETSSPQLALRTDRLRATYSAGVSSAGGPRNLQVLGPSRLVFSLGGRLIGMNEGAGEDTFTVPSASESEIVALVPDDLRMFVVHDDGTLCAIDRTTLAITCRQHVPSRPRTAGSLPWLGSTRLLIAGDDGAIHCVGPDDPLVTQYTSPHRGPRAVAGSSDLVAAISGDRQRLIVWNTWDGKQPAAEIYLTGLTRHRIADVDFG